VVGGCVVQNARSVVVRKQKEKGRSQGKTPLQGMSPPLMTCLLLQDPNNLSFLYHPKEHHQLGSEPSTQPFGGHFRFEPSQSLQYKLYTHKCTL
jgi:hypothetical protein